MKTRRFFLIFLLSFLIYLFMSKPKGSYKTNKNLPYHHLPDGTFRNLPGSPKRNFERHDSFIDFIKMFYKGIIKRELFDQKEIPDFIPNNHIVLQDNAKKYFFEKKDPLTITWLGHASFLIKINKTIILTDPYLSPIAGTLGMGPKRFVPPGIKIEDLPTIDIILISHNHYDHFDSKTLLKLSSKFQSKIFCPLNLSKLINDCGFNSVNEMDWYENYTFNDLIFTSVPAYHWSRRLGQKRNTTLWSGYIIEYNNKKIYFSGDTAYGNMFSEIGNKFGPFDLSIVPIGAYLPRDMMKSSHCTPEEAVEITKMLKSNNILGMHWGTVRLSAENPWEPPEKFITAAKLNGYKEKNIWKMAIGETRSLI